MITADASTGFFCDEEKKERTGIVVIASGAIEAVQNISDTSDQFQCRIFLKSGKILDVVEPASVFVEHIA